jgi:hypothetical protein
VDDGMGDILTKHVDSGDVTGLVALISRHGETRVAAS